MSETPLAPESPVPDALYRLFVDGVRGYAVLLLDPEGRITAWNRGAEAIFGYTEGEVVGQSAALIFNEADRAAGVPEAEIGEAAADGSADDDRWHVRRGGSLFWANGLLTALRRPDGGLEGFVKILRDNTRAKEAQDAIQESGRRLEQALEAAEMGAWTHDVASGQTTLDARAQAIFGVDRPVVAAADIDARVHPDDRAEYEAARRAALSSAPDDEFSITHRIVRPDGEVRWVRGQARVVFGEDGPVSAAGVVQDVTAVRAAEAEVRRTNAELEARVAERTAQVHRLAAQLAVAEQRERDRIARVLHDDLQQRIYGALMMLTSVAPDVPDAAADAFARVGQILSESMALTRTLSAELRPLPPTSETFGGALRGLAAQARERYGLGVEVGAVPDVALLDPTLRTVVVQVVGELLFNVAKHAGTDRARITAAHTDAGLAIRIEDAGRGFAAGAAWGSGLTSATERLALVGGQIDVASRAGEGTTVTVTVPPRGGAGPGPGETPDLPGP